MLRYANPTAVLPATTDVTLAAGSTLDFNGISQQVASLADSGGSGGSVSNSATGSPVVLTLSPAAGSTKTFSGGITGGGNGAIRLVMNGGGTQILAGSNTYTGLTDISQGTLLVNRPGSLSMPSAVTVASAATFGGTGTAGGAVTFNSGAKASFTVTPTAGVNTTPMTIAGVMTFNATEVHLNLPAELANGTYTLATSGAVPVANGAFPAPVLDSGSYATGGSGVIALDTANQKLMLTVAGGVTNIYQNWAGGAVFTARNGEGVFNGIAWLLGAAGPSAANTVALLPKPVPGGSGLTLRFLRVHDIGTARLYLQFSNDPGTWNSSGVLIPANTYGSNLPLGDGISATISAGTMDDITLTIPASLALDGKLFARLAATE